MRFTTSCIIHVQLELEIRIMKSDSIISVLCRRANKLSVKDRKTCHQRTDGQLKESFGFFKKRKIILLVWSMHCSSSEKGGAILVRTRRYPRRGSVEKQRDQRFRPAFHLYSNSRPSVENAQYLNKLFSENRRLINEKPVSSPYP